MFEDEKLRHKIEDFLETAEEYMRDGLRHRAYIEFEKAAALLKSTGKSEQLEQLWAHAATGFTAAKASFEAGNSYVHLAQMKEMTGRKTEARNDYLDAANAFNAIRNKTRDTWGVITNTVERAIDLSIELNEPATAIDLLLKTAMIHHRETGYTIDAINCLERAQVLLKEVPNHPQAETIKEHLQLLLEKV